jgi:hypothetical protein
MLAWFFCQFLRPVLSDSCFRFGVDKSRHKHEVKKYPKQGIFHPMAILQYHHIASINGIENINLKISLLQNTI